MSKRNIIFISIAVILVIIIGLFAVFSRKNKDYSVVYMASGEVYVGKLTTFPNLELKDAYLFQAFKDEKDSSKNNFSLNPVKDTLWAPKKLYLNKDQIIFYGPLSETSKIAETLAAQKK